MIKSRHIDRICIAAMGLAALLTLLLIFLSGTRLSNTKTAEEYAVRLFDDSRVHTIDLQVEDWEAFIQDAEAERYVPCTAVINGEAFQQVGLRTKGNNSLRLTSDYGLYRYSLKLEFDHYLDGGNYYGLDKFSLDASFQDNTYMKTWLAYDMMEFMGVPAPLCSYVWVTVNGQPWGLFLAVEEPEESFVRRVYGSNAGQLYKPEYLSLNADNSDIALQYSDDEPESYANLFRNAKFDITYADQKRLIEALYILSTGGNLDTAVDVDQTLRYFAAQVFLMNQDSYLGRTGHNYYLYEENGRLSILPWDYNLAFGTYALGMTDPIRDPNILINYPIHTPAPAEVMLNRPLYHNLMKNDEYFAMYRSYMNQLIRDYFESGLYERKIRQIQELTTPYVQSDPTAFCSYKEYLQAVDTLLDVCRLRAESIRGQLDGRIPATFKEQAETPKTGVDASGIDLTALGYFDDLEHSKARQEAALKQVLASDFIPST